MDKHSKLWRLVAAKPYPRIHVVSDLHLETGPYALPEGLDFDVLVAAGDIGPVEHAVAWLAAIGKPVIYVLGNHEFWGRQFDEVLRVARAAARGTQVHVLERTQVVISGVRFLGTTLWTSFGEWHPNLVYQSLCQTRDFKEIGALAWYSSARNLSFLRRQLKAANLCVPSPEAISSLSRFHPAIAYQAHLRAVAWLQRELATPFNGPTVVVTHHAPTFRSLEQSGFEKKLLDPITWGHRDDQLVRVASYASPRKIRREWRRDVSVWIHGHLHHGLDFVEDGVRVVCNPRGYAQTAFTEREIDAFSLFGYPVSEEDVARRNALLRDHPYAGDAVGFNPHAIVELAEGNRPVVSSLVKPAVSEIAALAANCRELVAHVEREDILGDCVRRCFDANVDAVRRVIADAVAQLDGALDEPNRMASSLRHEYGRLLFDGPTPDRDDMVPAPDDYQRCAERLESAASWLKELPEATLRWLCDWASEALNQLDRLRFEGHEAYCQPLPASALRLRRDVDVTLIVAATPEVCEQLQERLREQSGNGFLLRYVLIRVRPYAEVSQEGRTALLTRDILSKLACTGHAF